jgi:hypothetical protein
VPCCLQIVAFNISAERLKITKRRLGPRYPHSGGGSSSLRPQDLTQESTSS